MNPNSFLFNHEISLRVLSDKGEAHFIGLPPFEREGQGIAEAAGQEEHGVVGRNEAFRVARLEADPNSAEIPSSAHWRL